MPLGRLLRFLRSPILDFFHTGDLYASYASSPVGALIFIFHRLWTAVRLVPCFQHRSPLLTSPVFLHQKPCHWAGSFGSLESHPGLLCPGESYASFASARHFHLPQVWTVAQLVPHSRHRSPSLRSLVSLSRGVSMHIAAAMPFRGGGDRSAYLATSSASAFYHGASCHLARLLLPSGVISHHSCCALWCFVVPSTTGEVRVLSHWDILLDCPAACPGTFLALSFPSLHSLYYKEITSLHPIRHHGVLGRLGQVGCIVFNVQFEYRIQKWFSYSKSAFGISKKHGRCNHDHTMMRSRRPSFLNLCCKLSH